jgi:hypothetical protein
MMEKEHIYSLTLCVHCWNNTYTDQFMIISWRLVRLLGKKVKLNLFLVRRIVNYSHLLFYFTITVVVLCCYSVVFFLTVLVNHIQADDYHPFEFLIDREKKCPLNAKLTNCGPSKSEKKCRRNGKKIVSTKWEEKKCRPRGKIL